VTCTTSNVIIVDGTICVKKKRGEVIIYVKREYWDKLREFKKRKVKCLILIE